MPYALLRKHRIGTLLIAEHPIDPSSYVIVHYTDQNGTRKNIRVRNPLDLHDKPLVVNNQLALVPLLGSLEPTVRETILRQIEVLRKERPDLDPNKLWPICRSIIIGRPLQIKLPRSSAGESVYTLGVVTKLVHSGNVPLRLSG